MRKPRVFIKFLGPYKRALCIFAALAILALGACGARDSMESNYAGDWDGVWDVEPAADTMLGWRHELGGRVPQANMVIEAPAVEAEIFFDMGDELLFATAATPPPAAAPGAGLGEVDWQELAGQGERHIIQSANVELTTEDFDGAVADLRQLAPAADGYIESEMLTARGQAMFTIVLRVPAARFEAVLRHVESLADVRFSSQWADDVTDRFYDVIGSLETRRIEEERILALIEEADTIHELLALETRLSNTRLTIETYLAQLSGMAGQIAYSTIAVTLFDMSEEDIIIAAPTLGERVGDAFGDSAGGVISALQSFVVFLAGAVIPLALAGMLLLTAFLGIRIIWKKVSASRAA